jgi:hypothetical protein
MSRRIARPSSRWIAASEQFRSIQSALTHLSRLAGRGETKYLIFQDVDSEGLHYTAGAIPAEGRLILGAD